MVGFFSLVREREGDMSSSRPVFPPTTDFVYERSYNARGTGRLDGTKEPVLVSVRQELSTGPRGNPDHFERLDNLKEYLGGVREKRGYQGVFGYEMEPNLRGPGAPEPAFNTTIAMTRKQPYRVGAIEDEQDNIPRGYGSVKFGEPNTQRDFYFTGKKRGITLEYEENHDTIALQCLRDNPWVIRNDLFLSAMRTNIEEFGM